MAQLIQTTPVLRTFFLGTGTSGVTLKFTSKNGAAFAVPSDGAVTDLTGGYYSVSLDATDTDTTGDLAYMFTAGGGTIQNPDADTVYAFRIGDVPNDGTGAIKLQQFIVFTFAGSAILIESADAAASAIEVRGVGGCLEMDCSAGIGVLVSSVGVAVDFYSTTQNALQLNADNADAVAIVSSAGVGVNIYGQVIGVFIECPETAGISISAAGKGITIAASGVGIESISSADRAVNLVGATDGISSFGTSGQGFICVGGTTGIFVKNSGVATSPTAGIGIEVIGVTPAVLLASVGDAAVVIQGDNDGMRISAGAGNPVNYGGTDLLSAIAGGILDFVDGIETSFTLRQALRLILSAVAGKSSLVANTRIFRDVNDTVNRIDATTDTIGQRTAVTYIK